VAEAEADIGAGQPKLRYGARGSWGDDLARTLEARFGVKLVVPSCVTDAATSSFDAGYNATVEAYLDTIYGPQSVATLWNEVQQRRKADYDEWVAEKSRAEPGATAARGNGD
jgi:hypothetical protein